MQIRVIHLFIQFRRFVKPHMIFIQHEYGFFLSSAYILKSKADFVILGGDFNAPPDNEIEETYQLVRNWMKNSIEEIFYKLNKWLNPHYATYGNVLNTW